jgi:hypothetical protein
MESDLHKILYSYLQKTDSKLLMPEVVYQELPVVYKKRLHEEYNKFVNAERQLHNLMITIKVNIEINIDEEVKYFIDKIDKTYSTFSKEFRIPYHSGMLEETVKRAIYKIRPCSDTKEEFRDTLLWLTILDVAKRQDEKNVVFITGNTKDFCGTDGELHIELKKDLIENDVSVLFYKDLSDFIKDHAEAISGIDEKRVLEILNQVETEKALFKLSEKDYLRDIERKLERKYDYVEDLEILSLDINVENYYIYEMRDETYLLMVSLLALIDIQVYIPNEDYDDDYGYPRRRMKHITKEIEAAIRLKYTLNENFDVIDWEVFDFSVF